MWRFCRSYAQALKCRGIARYDTKIQACFLHTVVDMPSANAICSGTQAFDPTKSLYCEQRVTDEVKTSRFAKCCGTYAFNASFAAKFARGPVPQLLPDPVVTVIIPSRQENRIFAGVLFSKRIRRHSSAAVGKLENAHTLSRYGAIEQAHGLVPIVESEAPFSTAATSSRPRTGQSANSSSRSGRSTSTTSASTPRSSSRTW